MTYVLFLLFMIVCKSFADREYSEYSSQFAENLIHEIEKRLGDFGFDSGSRQANPYSNRKPECSFQTEHDTIIKTKLSLEQGAIFLDSPDVQLPFGKDGCEEKCCQTEGCNLAVFKEKGDHACYLFNCGEPNKCNFSHHEGFSSIGLRGGLKYDQVLLANKNQHVQDLADLAIKTTLATTTTTKPTEKKDPVPLFGTCDDSKDCAGSGTECLAGYCVCTEGYHPQDGICRESCTKFQFECKNDGQPLMFPQCIAIYDTCDGVKHCKDGSDEDNCAPKQEYKGKATKSQIGSRPMQDNSIERIAPTNNQKVNGDVVKQIDSDQSNLRRPMDSEGGKAQQTLTTSSHLQSSTEYSNKAHFSASTSSVKPTELSSKLRLTVEPSLAIDNVNDGNQIGKTSNIKVSKVKIAHDSSSIDIDETAIVETIKNNKVINKTAMVVLALGLGITAVLLIFVGCRLRTVKRRLRRGRPLNSNEADYLINGMYL